VAGPGTNREPKVLRVGVVAPVQGNDPYDAMDCMSGLICDQVFDAPFTLSGGGGQLRAAAFAGRLRAEGDACYLAELRSDLCFSDGTPLAATHVVDSLSRSWSRETGARVRAVGNDRVRIELNRPSRRIEMALANSWAAVSLERDGAMIGTGPYCLAELEEGSEAIVRLVRNPHHPRGQGGAPIDEIHFFLHPPDENGNFGGLIRAIGEGKIDFTTALSRDDAQNLTGVRKLFQPGNSTSILFFNTTRRCLEDAGDRTALACSLDRYLLAKECFDNPAAFVARSLLPRGMAEYSDGINFSAEAGEGVVLPETLRLLTIWGPRPYVPDPLAVAQTIARQLRQVGVTVEIETTRDSEDYFEKINSGRYDMVLAGWIADTEDPADFLIALLSSEAIPDGIRSGAACSNISRWKDPHMEQLLQRYRQDQGKTVLNEILDRVRDEVPLFPLAYGSAATLVSLRVQHYEQHPLGSFPKFCELDLTP